MLGRSMMCDIGHNYIGLASMLGRSMMCAQCECGSFGREKLTSSSDSAKRGYTAQSGFALVTQQR